jgi:predicted secreted protein
MTLVSGTMVFFVIWWIMLFMVLPFGIHTDENPQKGFSTGAPKNPNLRKKFLITTILTAVAWSIIQAIMVNHLISFS